MCGCNSAHADAEPIIRKGTADRPYESARCIHLLDLRKRDALPIRRIRPRIAESCEAVWHRSHSRRLIQVCQYLGTRFATLGRECTCGQVIISKVIDRVGVMKGRVTVSTRCEADLKADVRIATDCRR